MTEADEAGATETPADEEMVPLHLPFPGLEKNIAIAVNRDLVRSWQEHRLVIGGQAGPYAIGVDHYTSRDGDGEEVYLRLLDLQGDCERWHMLVRSTVLGIACGDPEMTPSADGRGLIIHLVTGDLLVEVGHFGEVTTRPAAGADAPA